jgi:hypothetical protein
MRNLKLAFLTLLETRSSPSVAIFALALGSGCLTILRVVPLWRDHSSFRAVRPISIDAA